MKIALIGDGNSIHIRRWSQWFRAHGHEVQMISLTRLNIPMSEYDKCFEVQPKTGLFHYLRQVPVIRRMVRVWNPDIVHGHYLTSAGFYASLSGGKNVVVSAWGSDVYKDSNEALKCQCIRYSLRNSHLVFGDSQHILNTCKELEPGIRSSHKIIFGVDTEKFKKQRVKHDRFRFLSIRATAPIYNPFEIVLAFEKANLDAELWMYKPSVECQGIYDYVQSNPDLASKIKWVCKMPYDDMPYLYNQVDCGVSIPKWDSSSTAMLECMSCEVPVISGDIPQNQELIINGFNGLLSKIEITHLANQMAIAFKSDLEIMGERARDTVYHEADYETEMRKAEKLYLELLE